MKQLTGGNYRLGTIKTSKELGLSSTFKSKPIRLVRNV